jgi:hypothetical protein
MLVLDIDLAALCFVYCNFFGSGGKCFSFFFFIGIFTDITFVMIIIINVAFRIRYLISFFLYERTVYSHVIVYFIVDFAHYYYFKVVSSVRFMLGLSLCCYPTGFSDG